MSIYKIKSNYNKIVDQNSSNNNNIKDIIGNKNDTIVGNSLYSLFYKTNKYFHSAANTYPNTGV
jgi:hypothetical protein